jgi:phosphatidylglycerol:prolipoprotein diacylglycerol transferase
MSFATVSAVLLPGYVRLGGLRVPVFALFAALGLVAALALSQPAARRVRVFAPAIWDGFVVLVVAALVGSRLMLIALSPRTFLQYPLTVFALPSLSYAGLVVACACVWLFLRWKGVPVLSALDAYAPCVLLLLAVLQVGHFLAGTDAGMPTTLPWGVHTPGDTMLGRVHPVQIYTALAMAALCALAMQRLRQRRFAGEVMAASLIAGGVVWFALDMLRQPEYTNGTTLLDLDQYVALMAFLLGAWLWLAAAPKTVPASQRASVFEQAAAFEQPAVFEQKEAR